VGIKNRERQDRKVAHETGWKNGPRRNRSGNIIKEGPPEAYGGQTDLSRKKKPEKGGKGISVGRWGVVVVKGTGR